MLKKLIREKGTDCVEEKGVSAHTVKRMAYKSDYGCDPKDLTASRVSEAYEVSTDELFPLAEGEDDPGGDAA